MPPKRLAHGKLPCYNDTKQSACLCHTNLCHARPRSRAVSQRRKREKRKRAGSVLVAPSRRCTYRKLRFLMAYSKHIPILGCLQPSVCPRRHWVGNGESKSAVSSIRLGGSPAAFCRHPLLSLRLLQFPGCARPVVENGAASPRSAADFWLDFASLRFFVACSYLEWGYLHSPHSPFPDGRGCA